MKDVKDIAKNAALGSGAVLVCTVVVFFFGYWVGLGLAMVIFYTAARCYE